QLVELVHGSADEGFTVGVVARSRGTDQAILMRRLKGIRGADPEVLTPTPGADIERLRDADSLPWALVAFLSTVGVLSLAAAAAAVVRGRRRALGILRALGFTRANVRRAVTVQALALTISGLIVGIPAGLILGRSVWRWFAGDLGVAPDVIIPWP